MKTAFIYLGVLTLLMIGAWNLYESGVQPAWTFPGLQPESAIESWLAWGLEIIIGIWVFLLVSTILIGVFSGVFVLLLGVAMFLGGLFFSMLFPFLFPFIVLGFSLLLVMFLVRRIRSSPRRAFTG